MLNDTNIFIVDDSTLNPTELRARCRRLKREQGLDLVVVDYLQLMYVPGTSENRATEISEISRSLKALAREVNAPVVACSQLNRGLELRKEKRPVMSDLRESGAIEQDADLILFIYRDEVYDEESKDKGKAEIIIGKQRKRSHRQGRSRVPGPLCAIRGLHANQTIPVTSRAEIACPPPVAVARPGSTSGNDGDLCLVTTWPLAGSALWARPAGGRGGSAAQTVVWRALTVRSIAEATSRSIPSRSRRICRSRASSCGTCRSAAAISQASA